MIDSILFEIDRQTINDLNIFQNETNQGSIFNLFDKAITIGGKEKLREVFNKPLTDIEVIRQRIDAIQYLSNHQTEFIVDRSQCDFIDFYLKQHKPSKPLSKLFETFYRTVAAFNNNNEFYVIQLGVTNLITVLNMLEKFRLIQKDPSLPIFLINICNTLSQTLEHEEFAIVIKLYDKQKPNSIDIARTDYLFRYLGYERIKILMGIVYQLDMLTSVALQGKYLGYNLPVINANGEKILLIKGLFHPFIDKPVSNEISFDYASNVCFITGANMAGKSTLLKTVGICVYLSQLGLPIPAAYMETSTFNGLITTINLADDIHQGHSHFYKEVLRVKYVAQKLNDRQNLFVIFDELFRGTNVKDAHDASLEIISAFAKIRDSFFMVSTHIVEVAHDLEINNPNISFKYMNTIFDNNMPTFDYQLKDGVTKERLGTWIIKNEGITELIEQALNKKSRSV